MKKIIVMLVSFCLVGCSLKDNRQTTIYNKMLDGLEQLDSYQSANYVMNFKVAGITENGKIEGSFLKNETYQVTGNISLSNLLVGNLYYVDEYLYWSINNQKSKYHIALGDSFFSIAKSGLQVDSVITDYSSSSSGQYVYYTLKLNEKIINNLLNLYISQEHKFSITTINISTTYLKEECVGIVIDATFSYQDKEYTIQAAIVLSDINSAIEIELPDLSLYQSYQSLNF